MEEGDERANLSDNRCIGVDASCTVIFRLRPTRGTSSIRGENPTAAGAIHRRAKGANNTRAGAANHGAHANIRRSRLSWSTRVEGWSLASHDTQRSGRLVVGCGRILVFLSPAERRPARLRV